MLAAPVVQSVNRIVKSFKEMEKVCIDRKQILNQALLALVTRNHLLLEGPPGVAKSHLAHVIFDAMEDEEPFMVQCTKKMSEDYLVGPLDMRLFREQGEYYHRVEGYLPTARYAFLDEFLDLSTGALRALLEILNERTFSRGPQSLKCPLSTAIAATNFSGDADVAVDAVMDRFLFKAKVRPLSDIKKRKAMLMLDVRQAEIPKFSNQDVQRVAAAAARVLIPSAVLDVYLQVCDGLKLTDRTVRKALCVLRASAVLNKRDIVMLEDLPTLEMCFVVSGDPNSEAAFSKAISYYRTALSAREAAVNAVVLSTRVGQLRTMVAAAQSYAEALPAAYETREAQQALSSIKTSDNADSVNKSLAHCQSILDTASKIYNKEKK